MVLTTRGWQTVLQNGDFKDLLAQTVSESQLVFMGYGFKDPDFEHIWSQLLIERFFRLPAIYCCHEGALPAEQLEQFRQKNVQVLNFPDNGSFEYVPSILQKLLEHGSATSHVVNATLPGVAAQELEKYVFLCIQFSPLQQNRLLLVSKAIALDYFSRETNDQITETKLIRHVCEMLGQDSFLIKQSGEAALKELIADGIVHLEADELKPDAAKLRAISAEVVKIDAAEREWVGRVLAKQVRQLGVEIDAGDRDNVVHVFDIVLLELGRDLAELILFNRPPKDEFKRVDESVDEITKILDISDKRRALQASGKEFAVRTRGK